MLSPIKGQVAVNVFFPTGLKNDDVMVMVKSENCMLNHDYLTTPGLYLSTYLEDLKLQLILKATIRKKKIKHSCVHGLL